MVVHETFSHLLAFGRSLSLSPLLSLLSLLSLSPLSPPPPSLSLSLFLSCLSFSSLPHHFSFSLLSRFFLPHFLPPFCLSRLFFSFLFIISSYLSLTWWCRWPSWLYIIFLSFKLIICIIAQTDHCTRARARLCAPFRRCMHVMASCLALTDRQRTYD